MEYLTKQSGFIPQHNKMEQNNKSKKANTKGRNNDFPLTILGVAEEALLAVDKAGGKIDTQTLSTALNVKGGAFARKLSSVKRWGLVSGSGTLVVTELGKNILHPISDEELAQSKKEAFLRVPLFSELYERFKTNLPDDKVFVAILIREHNIKDKDARTILGIYKNSIKEFLSLVPEQKEEKPKDKPQGQTPFNPNIKTEGKLSIYVSSPMGNNNFNANNKEELELLKKKLEKLFALIEDDLPNNQTGPKAEEPKPSLSSEVSRDNSEIAN